ncbi:hypothetical protein IW492_02870 [Enterococcus sp. BWB1-3]|uniref:hypothetical protein n=1 Tax=Enterococcus sp. BWB1-3 TaxID=2787713 RepID=UPI0019210390|nr:hypothetical protein [Enterococcus sp. BWB1-3]MBL1228174.1 hypothetical protein [Enterococcus sp. BWB1-3]
MAVRTLLKKEHLPDLEKWLKAKGYRIEEPKGTWEVFRAFKGKKNVILHERNHGIKDSVTVANRDEQLIRNFIKERRLWTKILSSKEDK